MDEPPRKRFAAAAVGFHGTAIAVIVGLGLYLLYKIISDPATTSVPVAEERRLQDAVSDIRKWIDEKRTEPPAQAPKPPPRAAAPPPSTPPAMSHPAPAQQGAGPLLPLEADRVWRYAVSVDPPTWRDIVLTYRVPREGDRLVVYTDFRHAAGEMHFKLGALQAGDPAHANVRFPGFFLHSAYIDFPLIPGQRLMWSWPWQLPGGAVRAGRVKQFEGVVAGWEALKVPAGTFNAVRIDVVIKYMENGNLGGTSRETIWLAPKVWGVAKVVREGVAPDEGFRRIVAELAEFR
jgi:hypothetical protein